MIGGAGRSTGSRRCGCRPPRPSSSGRPSGSTTRPSNPSPTGTRTTSPVPWTVSPAARSFPASSRTQPMLSALQLRGEADWPPLGKRSSSSRRRIGRPETVAMPSPTCSTRPTCSQPRRRSSRSSRPCASGSQSSSVFESVRHRAVSSSSDAVEVVAPGMAQHGHGDNALRGRRSAPGRSANWMLDGTSSDAAQTLAATLPRRHRQRERRDHADQTRCPGAGRGSRHALRRAVSCSAAQIGRAKRSAAPSRLRAPCDCARRSRDRHGQPAGLGRSDAAAARGAPARYRLRRLREQGVGLVPRLVEQVARARPRPGRGRPRSAVAVGPRPPARCASRSRAHRLGRRFARPRPRPAAHRSPAGARSITASTGR